jgi:hypothetical protein
MLSLNSRTPLPSERPISGRRFGPKTSSKTARRIRSSGRETPKGMGTRYSNDGAESLRGRIARWTSRVRTPVPPERYGSGTPLTLVRQALRAGCRGRAATATPREGARSNYGAPPGGACAGRSRRAAAPSTAWSGAVRCPSESAGLDRPRAGKSTGSGQPRSSRATLLAGDQATPARD